MSWWRCPVFASAVCERDRKTGFGLGQQSERESAGIADRIRAGVLRRAGRENGRFSAALARVGGLLARGRALGSSGQNRSPAGSEAFARSTRSEEHTSELQSHVNLVCRLLLEK